MKNKVLKIGVVILLIMTLTMTNFIFLGSNLVSYAIDDITTNNKNIEFSTYFKNSSGERVTSLDRTSDMQDISLYLSINVKKEGFFTGQVELSNSNFNIVNSESEYVSKISENKVYLNQINAGTTAEIELKIKTIEKDKFDLNMLSCESELALSGIYRDSSEKDIEVKATRKVNLNLVETNNNDSVENTLSVITNKVLKISGEDKRVIQLSLNVGLKGNNYPLKEIYEKIKVPEINGKTPEVSKEVNLNTMSAFEYKYENGYVEIIFTNNKTDDNSILWKKQGNENVILTYIYDADVDLENVEINSEAKVKLQNDKELVSDLGKVTLSNEEIDTAIEVKGNNSKESIYKGKLYSAIDKQYASKTTLDVNLANVEEYISIKEERSRYISDDQETYANIYYNVTTLNKESFEKILGQEGKIEIYNENSELIAEIRNDTEADENGNFVINYEGKEPTSIEIKTTKPISEGTLEFNHIKTIKASDINTLKSAKSIATKIVYGYNNYNEDNQTYTKGIEAEIEMQMGLNETYTEAKLEINRNSMSTVIANDIEMKLILKTDSEDRDLYKNPVFRMELPEQVENIQINSINLLYEDELKIVDYSVDGRYITIKMEGEQTSYKAQSVEGANIIINATVNINKTAVANSQAINVTYINEKANTYSNNEEIGKISKGMEIVAPKDVTAINSIKSLDVETVGEDEETSVDLQRGTESKRLEIDFEVINNNKENIQDVSILGTFPTKTDENNIDIKVLEGINVENATVYYTENADANTDLQNSDNGWTEEITNPNEVKKYLVKMDQIDANTVVGGSYTVEVPENLEYNQTAKEGYEVAYTKAQTGNENSVKATTLSMETGVGPKLESKLTATVGNEELKDASKVKSGEVIKYKVQVSNVGSVDVTNVKVTGQIPTRTSLVKPTANYEYTEASYYKEVEADKYEAMIESLQQGETKTLEYEVMVKSDTADGTAMTNSVEIGYLDVIQKSNEIKFTSEEGNLRAMVKRRTDRRDDIYEYGSVVYSGIVKNISSETIKDVKVKTNKSDNLEISSLSLISGVIENEVSDDDLSDVNSEEMKGNDSTGNEDEEFQETTEDRIVSEDIEYSDEINIGTLEPGESKMISYGLNIKDISEDSNNAINFSIITSDGKKEYRSNEWEDKVNNFDIDMAMKSNTESKYVKPGDNITYTIKIKNNSKSSTTGLKIEDKIPSQLLVNRITINGEEHKVNDEDDISNYIEINKNLDPDGEMTIEIETNVDYTELKTEAEAITNIANATVWGEEIAKTAEVDHIIKAYAEDEEGNNQGNNEGNNEGNGEIADGNQMISGLAWYDTDGNGKKDDGEQTLSDIKVKLLNVDTNQFVKTTSGEDLETTTNENGMYVLDKIANGKYIVIFDYDMSKYSLTKYKAEGIGETENSDASLNELLIGDEKQQVASTDIINIDNNDVSDISIGLIELKNFDLKLDKYVNKILIQNSAGTTVKEYNNSTTAKVELDAKQIKGSTVIVEYNIVVTNVGEVAGYARNIADYMPSDLSFNSELNKDWYEKDNTLYTSSIGNDIINPGEAKTITLTLTKTMGEDNVVARNTAEIYEAYNDLGLQDSNSTPGNKANGENDTGSADVIVSIRTGGVIYMTIGIIVAVLVIAGIVTAVIVKRKNLVGEE